jgi:hypothetical protein
MTLAAPTADSAATPSAIDVASVSHARFPERSSDALLWDVALRKTGGALYFRPYPGSGTQIGAGINGPTSEDFAKLKTAPSRSNYGDTTVVVQEGKTYTVRSRQVAEVGTVCVHYAKLSPLVANVAAGTVRIVLVSSAQCSDRRLTDDG